MKSNFFLEIKKKFKDKSLFTKISQQKSLLILFSSEFYNVNNDPINELVNNYEEIKAILNLNNSKTINYFYNNKIKIHHILYDEEQLIEIVFDETKKNLPYNFILNLLILEDFNVINYTYNIEYIKKINNLQRETNSKLKKIIISKIIIDLINNYKQIGENEEEEEEEGEKMQELEELEKSNLEIIKNNIIIFKEMGINLNKEDILVKKCDEIYSDIINSLIMNHKLEDFEYSYEILQQLELENIHITPTMLSNLSKILNENKILTKKYIIKKKEDLLDQKKINFYYLLFKYILKDSFYIYQIFNYFYPSKKFIMNLIKKNELSYDNIKEENKDKLKYVLNIFMDSQYYFEKLIELNKLKEILKYYEEFLFESKKGDIEIIKDIIKNNKNIYEEYLKDYEIVKKSILEVSLLIIY